MADEVLCKTETAYNVFRDSPVRFLGYANEVGESFRYQFPRFVRPSYILAFGYCAMDATTSGYNTWKALEMTNNRAESGRSKELQTVAATVDSLIWQRAAINAIVRSSRFAMTRMGTVPMIVRTWLPTGVGLSSIPFIVTPIDDFVDYAMDRTVREWLSFSTPR